MSFITTFYPVPTSTNHFSKATADALCASGGLISLVVSIMVFWWLLKHRRRLYELMSQNPETELASIAPLIWVFVFGNILYSLGFYLSSFNIANNATICSTQGVILTFGANLFSWSISILSLRNLKLCNDVTIKRNIVFVLIISTFLALVPLWLSDGYIYTIGWCWIRKKNYTRWVCYYVETFLATVLSCFSIVNLYNKYGTEIRRSNINCCRINMSLFFIFSLIGCTIGVCRRLYDEISNNNAPIVLIYIQGSVFSTFSLWISIILYIIVSNVISEEVTTNETNSEIERSDDSSTNSTTQEIMVKPHPPQDPPQFPQQIVVSNNTVNNNTQAVAVIAPQGYIPQIELNQVVDYCNTNNSVQNTVSTATYTNGDTTVTNTSES